MSNNRLPAPSRRRGAVPGQGLPKGRRRPAALAAPDGGIIFSCKRKYTQNARLTGSFYPLLVVRPKKYPHFFFACHETDPIIAAKIIPHIFVSESTKTDVLLAAPGLRRKDHFCRNMSASATFHHLFITLVPVSKQTCRDIWMLIWMFRADDFDPPDPEQVARGSW